MYIYILILILTILKKPNKNVDFLIKTRYLDRLKRYKGEKPGKC